MNTTSSRIRRIAGFSLVELMVAMLLGILLTWAAASVYLSTKSSFRRQEQLSALQQNVRMAFEYLAGDARMAGHMGCYTGQTPAPTNDFAAGTPAEKFKTDYTLGIEGYEYTNAAANELTLSATTPSDITDASEWDANTDPNGTTTIPVATIAGTGKGLTPGSDVLVIRTVAGNGVRLTAASAATKSLSIESLSGGGNCPDGTAKVSGLCRSSHVLVANCTSARMFPTTSTAGSTLTTPGDAFTVDEYLPSNTEVFPLQTAVYYVKQAASGEGTSLYRRVFDGTVAAGVEHELIHGVENLQLRYGRDTTPTADGAVDAYASADDVTDWNRVVTVRMSLLMRAPERLPAGVQAPASGVLNGVTVTFPDSLYDRRVFTTTVAVRNKTASF